MRRTMRFGLNVAIALFVVLVSWMAGLIISSAPMPFGGRVSGFQIDGVLIPGQAIACTQDGQQDLCQIQLFGQPLKLTTTPSSNSAEFLQCEFTYRNQTAACEGDYHAFVIGGSLPLIKTDSNLGLTATEQATLREQYPQRNFFLYSVGENRLLKWNTGAAIAAGVLTFLFGLLNYHRKILFAFLGLVVFVVMFLFGTGMLMALGYVD